jgi:hypothetical protein
MARVNKTFKNPMNINSSVGKIKCIDANTMVELEQRTNEELSKIADCFISDIKINDVYYYMNFGKDGIEKEYRHKFMATIIYRIKIVIPNKEDVKDGKTE